MAITMQLTGFNELLRDIDILQRSQLKFVLQQSLNKGLAPKLRANEQQVIKRTFNKVNPLTASAPMTTEWANFNSLAINFKLRDRVDGGQSPAAYLYPQVAGGDVYVTRFNRRLRLNNAIAATDYVWYWGSGRRTSGASLQRIANELEKENGEYFILPPSRRPGFERSNAGVSRRRRPVEATSRRYVGPGVYRSKGDQIERVFILLSETPTVTAKYGWNEQRLTADAERLFSESVTEQMAKIFS